MRAELGGNRKIEREVVVAQVKMPVEFVRFSVLELALAGIGIFLETCVAVNEPCMRLRREVVVKIVAVEVVQAKSSAPVGAPRDFAVGFVLVARRNNRNAVMVVDGENAVGLVAYTRLVVAVRNLVALGGFGCIGSLLGRGNGCSEQYWHQECHDVPCSAHNKKIVCFV